LIKLFSYILFKKYINILALEMTSPGNRHCANCICTFFTCYLCYVAIHVKNDDEFESDVYVLNYTIKFFFKLLKNLNWAFMFFRIFLNLKNLGF